MRQSNLRMTVKHTLQAVEVHISIHSFVLRRQREKGNEKGKGTEKKRREGKERERGDKSPLKLKYEHTAIACFITLGSSESPAKRKNL